MKFAADALQRNCKYNGRQRNRPSTNTEFLKIKHVWAMVWKLKQRVAWVGQRMIESRLIKATSWTQQNRKMQVMSLESNNPKDGYSAGGRKHWNYFVLWDLRLQKTANKKSWCVVLAKQALAVLGGEQRGTPWKQREGGKSFCTISMQPAQGFNFVHSISFSSSAINEQQTGKISEAIDKQTWKNLWRRLRRVKYVQLIKEQPWGSKL